MSDTRCNGRRIECPGCADCTSAEHRAFAEWFERQRRESFARVPDYGRFDDHPSWGMGAWDDMRKAWMAHAESSSPPSAVPYVQAAPSREGAGGTTVGGDSPEPGAQIERLRAESEQYRRLFEQALRDMKSCACEWDIDPKDGEPCGIASLCDAHTEYFEKHWRPAEPPIGLLVSMAIRWDHALGVPGYYDQVMFSDDRITHRQRLQSAVDSMRQVWEEVAGRGFYRPEKEAEYAAMLSDAPVALGSQQPPEAAAPKDWKMARCEKHGRVYVKWHGCSMCESEARDADR